YARIKSFSDEDCEINFRRRLDGNTWHIEVEEGPACQSLHGHNTSFGGIYAHAPESVVNWGYLDEIELNEIERLTGDFLPVFLDNFQQISIDQYTDKSEFKVITAGVKGMYTIMESIVILDDRGGIWCACLDANDEVVRYFTN